MLCSADHHLRQQLANEQNCYHLAAARRKQQQFGNWIRAAEQARRSTKGALVVNVIMQRNQGRAER
jgi:hypothetical protein